MYTTGQCIIAQRSGERHTTDSTVSSTTRWTTPERESGQCRRSGRVPTSSLSNSATVTTNTAVLTTNQQLRPPNTTQLGAIPRRNFDAGGRVRLHGATPHVTQSGSHGVPSRRVSLLATMAGDGGDDFGAPAIRFCHSPDRGMTTMVSGIAGATLCGLRQRRGQRE